MGVKKHEISVDFEISINFFRYQDKVCRLKKRQHITRGLQPFCTFSLKTWLAGIVRFRIPFLEHYLYKIDSILLQINSKVSNG